MKKDRIKNRGFTLLELLIVLAIIGIVSTTFSVTYKEFIDKYSDKTFKNRFLDDIKHARHLAAFTNETKEILFFEDKYIKYKTETITEEVKLDTITLLSFPNRLRFNSLGKLVENSIEIVYKNSSNENEKIYIKQFIQE